MIWGSNSILSRIVWLHVVTLSIAAVALPLASYLLLSSTANSFENQTLRAHAAQLSRYVHWTGNEWRLDLPDDLKTFYAHGFDGFAFSVLDADGRLIGTSRPIRAPIFKGPVNLAAPEYFQMREGSAVYYGASVPEKIDGRTVRIEVAQNLEHPDVILDDVVADFLKRVMWFTIPIMLLVLAVDVFVVRRALRPVTEASKQASTIDPQQLTLRVPANDLPVEVRPLVTAFNQVLDRLEHAFRLQREFTADAAHELRTPLSVLRARCDSLPDQTALAPIRHDIDVMARIVDQLLEVADLESRSIDLHEILDLRSVCVRVVEHLAPIAKAEGKRVVLSGSPNPVLVRGDADLLFQAVRNLAENAVRYTPAGTAAEIRLENDATVRVTDEGQGVPEEGRDHIFRRFWRADRSRSSGAGLGLAIASRIVGAHGGTIEVGHREPTGAMFTMKLNAVSAA